MSVLVTGGGGYIGSHMVWALLDAGENVIVVDNFTTGFTWALPAECRVYEGNIGDDYILNRVFLENDIEAIIHFAGSSVVPASVLDPLSYYKNNTANSRTLIEHAVRFGVKQFVFSSTAAVYGTQQATDLVDETRDTRPESPYGFSKLMTEIMLQDTAAAHDFNYTALRYFNVAGADPKGRTGQSTKHATHLIKTACQVALGERPFIEIFGNDYPTFDGTCIRDFIHVWDLVQAHLLALKNMRDNKHSLTLNCGYGRGYSVLEVIDITEQVSGTTISRKVVSRRPGDPMTVIADPTRAMKILGWCPQYDDIKTIIQGAFDWECKLRMKNSA